MTKKEGNSAERAQRINNRICLYRREKGWRQKDLAFLLGISAFQVSRWERGRAKPTLYHAIGLEVACSRLVDDIYRPYFDEWQEKIKGREKLLNKNENGKRDKYPNQGPSPRGISK